MLSNQSSPAHRSQEMAGACVRSELGNEWKAVCDASPCAWTSHRHFVIIDLVVLLATQIKLSSTP